MIQIIVVIMTIIEAFIWARPRDKFILKATKGEVTNSRKVGGD